jgi:hypothetical protein
MTMTESAGLQESLAAMGFAELALAFVCLTCYAMLLNGALGATARLAAGASAVIAAGALAALTDPWTNGVILIAIGVAGIGLFVIAVWGISAACGLTGRHRAGPATGVVEAPRNTPATTSAVIGHTNRPAHSA